MSLALVPWLELAVLVPLLGAPVVWRAGDPRAAARRCLAFSGVGLGCAAAACAGFALGVPAPPGPFALDAISAPLVPFVALLHALTALATARTKQVRFSFAGLLIGQAVRVATFACAAPEPLAALLILGTLPPYFDLRARGQSARVYALHMGLFAVLLVAGVQAEGTPAAVLLLLAVLVRGGTFPAHLWVTDLFERASFGGALLAVAPVAAMYAALRLVLPLAPPEWVLQSIGLASLLTAVYTAGMALVQTDARRFFAFLFLSHSALVLVGMELHTELSLTGALALWASAMLSLSGFGLTLRALEARFGRLSLSEYRGLATASPALAACFLLTGLACVGFPGTSGFVAAELLVDGAIDASPLVGLGVVAAAALNGVAVLRAYFLLFTGARYAPAVPLGLTPRERVAVLTLAALILGGGLFPQLMIGTAHPAAQAAIRGRP